MTMLESALSGRDNALNFVRLALAVLVILSHSWPLGGYGTEPVFGGPTLGSVAVGGFFAISGYLITGSRMRLRLGRFLLNRVLRIFPGFWVCIIAVAFVIAPAVSFANGQVWSAGSALGFVVRNSALWQVQDGIATGPTGVPTSGAWNGSLWTLAYEFAAYLVTAVLLSFRWIRRHIRIVAGTALAGFIVFQWSAPHLISDLDHSLLMSILAQAPWLGTFYAAGMLLFALAPHIRLRPILAVSATSILLLAAVTGTTRTLGALPLAFIVLWLGAVLPIRLGAVNDVSYGTYIYAFPLQQSLAMFGMRQLPIAAFCILSLLITLPIAWVSWKVVERPAIRVSRTISSIASRALQPRSEGRF